jgi:hypothetical protein
MGSQLEIEGKIDGSTEGEDVFTIAEDGTAVAAEEEVEGLVRRCEEGETEGLIGPY